MLATRKVQKKGATEYLNTQ